MRSNMFFSDDDEEIVEYLNTPYFFRRVIERTYLFNTYRDDEFIKRFRIPKRPQPCCSTKYRTKLKNHAVTPMNQLLCTLRYYATGSQLTTCGDVIGVHESTACRIVHRVTHAIAYLRPEYIQMATTAEDQTNVVSAFYKIARFPRVLRAIDCTHIKILSPGGEDAEIFRIRKGWFSINTQAICSADLLFRDIVARWHGSAHDANIWDNCAQKRDFLHGVYGTKMLLGDSGYAQTSYMMTPLSDTNINSRAQQLYQEAQIKSRNVIERAFEVWKRRFPILSKGINIKLQRVPGIIIATAVLHNIAIMQKDCMPPEDNETPYTEQDNIFSQNEQRGSSSGNNARTLLINDYFGML